MGEAQPQFHLKLKSLPFSIKNNNNNTAIYSSKTILKLKYSNKNKILLYSTLKYSYKNQKERQISITVSY